MLGLSAAIRHFPFILSKVLHENFICSDDDAIHWLLSARVQTGREFRDTEKLQIQAQTAQA